MKGTKTQKGITLIALIITIVVLLILAVVAINSIVNTDLIAHAENAAKTYNNSVKNEADILAGYLDRLEDVTRCKHYYGDDIYCDYCEEKCTHIWDSNGTACTTCPFTCEHTYTNGKCVEENCGYVCPHNNVGNDAGVGQSEEGCLYTEICLDCWVYVGERVEDHNFYDGYCGTCGYECKHTSTKYDDPYSCGDASHETPEICNDCGTTINGLMHDHSYTNSVCSECHHTCTHDNGYAFSEGKCTYCDFECSHTTYTDGKCTVCGYECKHNWVDGTCTLCTMTACTSHNYYGGVCERCGFECPHNNTSMDGATTICSDCFFYW